MKSFLIALCALSIQFTLPWSQDNREWRAATYSGLTIGKSNRLDMLRVLGEPKFVEGPPGQTAADENPEAWYVYDRTAEISGELIVIVDELTNIVLGIDLHPKNLTKEDVARHFGPDFILTRYAHDSCMGNEESAPVYESPSGPILELEYRHRGIAVSLTEAGKVNTISYVSKPFGPTESKCKSSTALRPAGPVR